MKDTIITIPVYDNDSVKKLSVVPGHEKRGIKSFIVTINAKSFMDHADELGLFRAINPREPRRSSLAWKAMKETLDQYPEQFFYRNKGMLMLVDDFLFDNTNRSIKLILNNRSLHGIADGGHTFDVLKTYFSENHDADLENRVFFKVEFLVGFDTKEKVVEVVQGRNTALQVQEMTIQNMLNMFDDIKDVFDSKLYSDQISYSEYETDEEGKKKKIKVTDLIGYIVTYNLDIYPLRGEKVPIDSYSSKKKSLETFEKMYNDKTVKKYSKLLPEIVELWDSIYYNMPKIMGKNFKNISKSNGDLVIKERKIHLPYIDEDIDYMVPAGWIYPLFASFRNLLVEENGTIKFSENPSKFLKKNITNIARPYKKALRESNYEPQTFAKSRLVWKEMDFEMRDLLEKKR